MLEIIIAFGLDLLLGDPPYSWHPARLLGRLIQSGEPGFRARFKSERMAGLSLVLFVTSISWIATWFVCELAGQVHPFLKSTLTVYFLYSAISITDLQKEARSVYTCLVNKKLEQARQNLSRIVGRDTQNLDESEIVRGTVETVAESFVDGILAPLFYAAIGGAPLAIAYKAVNTLDSMIGHKTLRYREFGFWAARLDEIVNWVPARISWFLIGIGSLFINGRYLEAWRVGWKAGAARSFHNGVVPEAAFAGALGVQLGGVNEYQGQKVETPKLGYPMHPLSRNDIRLSWRLMKAGAWVALVFALLLRIISGWIWTIMFHPIS